MSANKAEFEENEVAVFEDDAVYRRASIGSLVYDWIKFENRFALD